MLVNLLYRTMTYTRTYNFRTIASVKYHNRCWWFVFWIYCVV